MKFVVAGTYAEYIQHIHKMGYNKNEYVYVSDPIQLRGLTEIEGFFIGSYENRPGIEEIKQTISYIKSRSKIYKASASQILPASVYEPFNSNGMNVAPTSIMLKNAGAWQIYDINNGEVK
jgi:hypothetical protein